MTRPPSLAAAAALLSAAALNACSGPPTTQPTPASAQATAPAPAAAPSAPPAPAPALEAPPDPDTLAMSLPDCSPATVLPFTMDLGELGPAVAPAICHQMTQVFRTHPQVRVLRSMLATITAYAAGDSGTEPRSLAELLVISHLRGADGPDALLATLATARKMRRATQERLTLDELLGFVKTSGPMAQSLSDDGLLAMAPVIVAMDAGG